MSVKPKSIFKRIGSAIWDKLLGTYEPELWGAPEGGEEKKSARTIARQS
jgi:hypothetical protein